MGLEAATKALLDAGVSNGYTLLSCNFQRCQMQGLLMMLLRLQWLGMSMGNQLVVR